MWVWLKINQEKLRRCWSIFPLTRVPLESRCFEPHLQVPCPGSPVFCRRQQGPGRLDSIRRLRSTWTRGFGRYPGAPPSAVDGNAKSIKRTSKLRTDSPTVNTNKRYGFSHCFKVVRNGFCPSTVGNQQKPRLKTCQSCLVTYSEALGHCEWNTAGTPKTMCWTHLL